VWPEAGKKSKKKKTFWVFSTKWRGVWLTGSTTHILGRHGTCGIEAKSERFRDDQIKETKSNPHARRPGRQATKTSLRKDWAQRIRPNGWPAKREGRICDLNSGRLCVGQQRQAKTCLRKDWEQPPQGGTPTTPGPFPSTKTGSGSGFQTPAGKPSGICVTAKIPRTPNPVRL